MTHPPGQLDADGLVGALSLRPAERSLAEAISLDVDRAVGDWATHGQRATIDEDAVGRAGGGVTDGGSLVAHASLVAREYGLPAVVGLGDATGRVRDGRRITVDGNTGHVELHD